VPGDEHHRRKPAGCADGFRDCRPEVEAVRRDEQIFVARVPRTLLARHDRGEVIANDKQT
jgi:hypothetical protein